MALFFDKNAQLFETSIFFTIHNFSDFSGAPAFPDIQELFAEDCIAHTVNCLKTNQTFSRLFIR